MKDRSVLPKIEYHTLIVSMLFLAGAALRFTCLGRQSLWIDEMTSISLSSVPLLDLLTGKVFDNHTPPLYYLLLKVWGRFMVLDEVGLRSFSALVDCLNIVLFYFISKKFLPPNRLYLCLGAYVFSPFLIYYAQEGRMYSLLVFWVLVYSIFIWKMLSTETKILPWSLAVGSVIACGVYTHYYFAFFAIGTYVVAFHLRKRSPKHLRALIIAGVLSVVLFSPWISVVSGLAQSGGQIFRRFDLMVLPYAFFRFVAGYAVFPLNLGVKDERFAQILKNLPVIILTFSAVFWLLKDSIFRPDPLLKKLVLPLLVILSVPILVPLLISTKTPILSERYLIVCIPPFYMLLFLGNSAALRKTVLLMLFTVFLLGDFAYFFSSSFGKAQWRQCAGFVSRAASESDLIMFNPEFSSTIFKFYFSKTVRGKELLSKSSFGYGGRMAGSPEDNRRIILISSGYRIGNGIEENLASRMDLIEKKTFPLETGIVVSIWDKRGERINE